MVVVKCPEDGLVACEILSRMCSVVFYYIGRSKGLQSG